MNAWLFVGVLAVALIANPALAAGRCDNAQWQKAADAAEKVKTWSQLYAFYQNHADCADDGGEIAEGLSDEVAKLIAYRWSGVGEVRQALQGHSGFAEFVLSRINTTWDWKDFKPARNNASQHCPSGLDHFCAAVVSEIDGADKESRSGR